MNVAWEFRDHYLGELTVQLRRAWNGRGSMDGRVNRSIGSMGGGCTEAGMGYDTAEALDGF